MLNVKKRPNHKATHLLFLGDWDQPGNKRFSSHGFYLSAQKVWLAGLSHQMIDIGE